MELDWVRSGQWGLTDRSYFVMTTKKTCWYTCISPCRVGAIIALGSQADLDALEVFGYHLGVAFQIQDDVLNLVAEEERYGKETAGDIWEGKRTLMLIHVVRRCSEGERARVVRIMGKARDRKSEAEVQYVLSLMDRYGSIDYARGVSRAHARKAATAFERLFATVQDSPHKAFLREAIEYVIDRDL